MGTLNLGRRFPQLCGYKRPHVIGLVPFSKGSTRETVFKSSRLQHKRPKNVWKFRARAATYCYICKQYVAARARNFQTFLGRLWLQCAFSLDMRGRKAYLTAIKCLQIETNPATCGRGLSVVVYIHH